MRALNRVAITSLCPDPDQPRKIFVEADLIALGHNMKQYGQRIPVISWNGVILDGERRWRAAQLVGITELDVVELTARPAATELRLLQMSLDVHRASLSAMERSDFLARIKGETNWSICELAEKLSMKQPLVTKLLKFQDGCEELRAALRAGSIDQDKAYTLACEADHARQRELLKDANGLTRQQLRQRAHSGGKPVELRTAIARFQVSKTVTVIVQGPRIDLSGAITALSNTVQALKKGQREGYDVVTASRVLADRVRSAK